MNTPTFSIVIPSFNQARFLEANLESVLSQQGTELEALVFDACSTDGSIEILKKFESDPRLRWISTPDLGQAHAINKGLRVARGRILAYLNSDDVYFPGALATVEKVFRDDPTTLFAYGRAHHLNEDGSFLEEYATEPWDFDRLQWVCFLCQPAVFWRREALDRFGYFDDTLHFAMDYEYWLRAGADTRFRYVEDAVLAGSRLHGDTKTLSQRVKVHRECLAVVLKHATSRGPVLNWLRHAAHHQAEAALRNTPDGGAVLPHALLFAREVLSLAIEFGVVPDADLQDEIDRVINDLEKFP